MKFVARNSLHKILVVNKLPRQCPHLPGPRKIRCTKDSLHERFVTRKLRLHESFVARKLRCTKASLHESFVARKALRCTKGSSLYKSFVARKLRCTKVSLRDLDSFNDFDSNFLNAISTALAKTAKYQTASGSPHCNVRSVHCNSAM
jgi:hypothetical protein